jgi:hypothetical protein
MLVQGLMRAVKRPEKHHPFCKCVKCRPHVELMEASETRTQFTPFNDGRARINGRVMPTSMHD